jgi:formylglycine-generating enzyme required for sulfatase activity
VVTFYGCSPDQASYEIGELGQGAFTYSLLEGLRLRSPGQNCATVERLDHHLRYQVPALNRSYGRPEQHPYARIEPLNKKYLILLPQAASLQDVLALKNDALEAETEGRLAVAEQLWIRVLGASVADRQAIEAIQRLARQSKRRTSSTWQTRQRAPNKARRQFLQYVGLGTGAMVTGAIGRSIFLNSQSSRVRAKPTQLATPIELEIGTDGVISLNKGLSFETVQVNVWGTIIKRQNLSVPVLVEDLGDAVKLDMVGIEAGSFLMGSPEEELEQFDHEGPQHQVYVPAFLMGRYPVTQAQWKAVAAMEKVERDLEPDPAEFKGVNNPIEGVSWYEAVEFCARLSKATGKDYRLPTEAQWEYACRAGTQTPFYFGPTLTADLANYDGSATYGQGPRGESLKTTTPVGNYSPNAWGLYDMHGNVWEWCLDHWHSNYNGAPTDGSAWLSDEQSSSRLLRGGSWSYNPGACRSASRDNFYPVARYSNTGFRVVCRGAITL